MRSDLELTELKQPLVAIFMFELFAVAALHTKQLKEIELCWAVYIGEHTNATGQMTDEAVDQCVVPITA